MSLSWPVKDPDDVLDYQIDWSKWLNGDTIVSSNFDLAVAGGLAVQSQDHAATTSTVWISGGTAGQRAQIHCRITTTAGRTKDVTIIMNIAER